MARSTKPVNRTALAAPRGSRVRSFIEKYVYVPEGALVGAPMILLPEQVDFIDAVYNNVGPDGMLKTRRGIFSIARKNGKTGLIAALLEAHIFGPEAKQNSQLYSAARSRDQAAVVFNYAAKSIRMNNKLEGLVSITDSRKEILGLRHNVLYKALSADATTAHGKSPALTIHDELGQVIGPTDALYDALETAGGAQLEPLTFIISTQAASDGDLLSTIIDDALRNKPEDTVCRLYAAEKDDDIFDPEVWYRVNFALGKFRMVKEFKEAADRAKRMPSSEATFRNLYLNMRISLQSLLVPPSLWKENDEDVDDDLFYSGEPVHFGLDLSQRTDLTAAVAAVVHPDTGAVHLKAFVYAPSIGVEERQKRDRVDYPLFNRQGYLTLVGGSTVDYQQVAEHLAEETNGMNIVAVNFDRWRIELFKKAAADANWCASDEVLWRPFGQGFKDMSPAVETFETVLLNRKLVHGSNPLLTMGAANTVATRDPAGNRKLDKSKSSGRIDPLVAAVMAVHSALAPLEDTSKEVTENDFFIM